ncbi:MAG: ornithine cyclodeaminase family protein [Hyphomicrobiales bacterium]|nr:ornithine cyclodeaminase family protein [Hyphomicrobiales bacterium]
MPLYIDEAQARASLSMADVIDALRAAFLAQAEGQVKNAPRTRTSLLGKSLNVTAASDAGAGRYAVKLYGGGNYHIHLYDVERGLIGTFEADWLGQLRTGAANGLAASLMARKASRRVGLVGAGRQAVAQLLALDAVGLMDEISVFARRREQGEAFCAEMARQVGARLTLAPTAEAAVADADIVVTATTSATPVFDAKALKPGAHINAMGANSAARMEIDPALVDACAQLVTDDVDQARKEAAEFIALGADFNWARVRPLSEIVKAGSVTRGEPDITLYKSLGAGLEDLAIASLLYDRLT